MKQFVKNYGIITGTIAIISSIISFILLGVTGILGFVLSLIGGILTILFGSFLICLVKWIDELDIKSERQDAKWRDLDKKVQDYVQKNN